MGTRSDLCEPGEAKFELGQRVATPAASAVLTRTEMRIALLRHGIGDWGDLSPEDRSANDDALARGGRLLSAYHSASGARFHVVTEADRSATTILLPSEH